METSPWWRRRRTTNQTSENRATRLIGNSSVYGIGKLLWWKISMHMMKYQHTCAGTPAYVWTVPKPHQPPHMSHFDILILLDQKEKLTIEMKIYFFLCKMSQLCYASLWILNKVLMSLEIDLIDLALKLDMCVSFYDI